MKNLNKGIILAFTASVISGIAIFYSKISITKIDPLILTTSRNFYVGILFFILIIFSGELTEIKKLTRKQFLQLTLIGLIGGALPFYLFFSGLQYIPAITANLIQKSLFIWVTFLAVILLKEKINKWYALSFILIFFGNYYFSKFQLKWGIGELMVLAATLLWALESILAKKILNNVSSELVGLFRMGTGSLLLLLSVVMSGKIKLLTGMNIQQLSIIFTGGTILFFYVFTWYKGLKFAPVSLVTLILTFALVVGNVLNGSFAGVKFQVKDIYSSVLISGALLLLIIQKLKAKSF